MESCQCLYYWKPGRPYYDQYGLINSSPVSELHCEQGNNVAEAEKNLDRKPQSICDGVVERPCIRLGSVDTHPTPNMLKRLFRYIFN